MNINYFLSLVFIGLSSIYFLFEPMDIKKQNFVDVPLFNLSKFTLYELDKYGLNTLMKGSKATRYSNRYVIKDIDYTDNSKEYISNMKAKNGLYQNDIVYLNGDVYYTRIDGLKFFSQEVTYNKKTDTTFSDVDYVATMGENQVFGSYILYDNKTNYVKSREVHGIYKIKEKK